MSKRGFQIAPSLAVALGIALVFGCNSDPEKDVPSMGDFGTTGASSSVPEACRGLSSPYLEAECLQALRTRCLELGSRSECDDRPAVSFEGSYVVECGWARVVEVLGQDACALAESTYRCEAREVSTLDGFDAKWKAWGEQSELIEFSHGPLGPWSAIDPPPEFTVRACADNVSPPSPSLCNCADEADAAP